jgi:UDP-3-O-[3-hydroxymyristoyl] glucosamine N-acyltransferase
LIDPRFYRFAGPLSFERAVSALGATPVHGGDTLITGMAPSSTAQMSELCYFDRPPSADKAALYVGACLVPIGMADSVPSASAVVEVTHPRQAFARIAANLVFHRPFATSTIGEAPRLDATAKIASDAVLQPGCVVGPGAQIGARSVIGANAVIGPGVTVGMDCHIGANASVTFALMGNRVFVSEGARIGGTGFGVAAGPAGTIDVVHMGRVIVQDDVSIGCNTTVDRGVFDDTVIGEGTKIDNLCQIAHNVILGRQVMIAALSGISGSTILEDGVTVAGAVGVADHLVIGKGARLAARAAVMHSVPAGETWGGMPAKPHKRFLREVAWLAAQASKRGN